MSLTLASQYFHWTLWMMSWCSTSNMVCSQKNHSFSRLSKQSYFDYINPVTLTLNIASHFFFYMTNYNKVGGGGRGDIYWNHPVCPVCVTRLCPDIFWTTQPFKTKLGMAVHHSEVTKTVLIQDNQLSTNVWSKAYACSVNTTKKTPSYGIIRLV